MFQIVLLSRKMLMKNSLWILILIVGCASNKKQIQQVNDSVAAGSRVELMGESVDLYKGKQVLAKGKSIDNFIGEIGNKQDFKGYVTIINIVPSIDTKVCEEQSHILGESKEINEDIKRVSISRDLPMAQSRFAKEAKLENITFLSDFKDASFGKRSGLLMTEKGLLARGVIVTDREGVVRYIQVVPDVTKLPNMQKAIDFANNL